MKSEIIKFDSGLTAIITEMKNYESVSTCVYVEVGSSNETPDKMGISHLIEHMFFKGTKKRPKPIDIINAFDDLGARNNAATGKNETMFFTKGTRETYPNCVELLSDMFFNSKFDEEELAREKNVVIEELMMYEDDPQSKAIDNLSSLLYEGTTYANPIGGYKNIVEKISREDILEHIKNFYTPDNVVIAVSGDIDVETAKEVIQKYFEDEFTSRGIKTKKNTSAGILEDLKENKQIKVYKENEQSAIIIGYRGVSLKDKDLKTAKILAHILGGGMSSRLFVKVREEKGLVYGINAGNEHLDDFGAFYIYFGTTPEKVDEALSTIKNEVENISKNGVTDEELKRAKIVISSSIKMQLENTFAVAQESIDRFIVKKEPFVKEELIKEFDDVTKEQVQDLAKRIFDGNYVISLVGPNEKDNLLEKYK